MKETKSWKSEDEDSPSSDFVIDLEGIMNTPSEDYCECEELLEEEIKAPVSAPTKTVQYAIEIFVPQNVTVDESMEGYLLAALDYAFRLNLASCGMERTVSDDIYSLSFINITKLSPDELAQSSELFFIYTNHV